MINKVISSADLKVAIERLRVQQSENWLDLKSQVVQNVEDIKPVNLIANSIGRFTESTSIRQKVVRTLVGLTAGYLMKKIVVGSSKNTFKQVLGSITQILVSGMVFRNTKPKTV